VLNELCGLEMAMPDDAPTAHRPRRRLEHDPDTAPELRAAIYVNQSHLAAARADDAAGAQPCRAGRGRGGNLRTPGPCGGRIFSWHGVRSRTRCCLRLFGKETWPRSNATQPLLSARIGASTAAFLLDKVAAYRSLADWLMEMGRIDEGLAVLKLMKTRSSRALACAMRRCPPTAGRC